MESYKQALVKRWPNFDTPGFIREFLYKWINFEQFWIIFEQFWIIRIVSNIFFKNLLQYGPISKKLQKCHISSVFRFFSEDFGFICSQLNKNVQGGIPTVMNHFWRYFWKEHVILVYCTSPDCLIPFDPHLKRCGTWVMWHLGHGPSARTWRCLSHSVPCACHY